MDANLADTTGKRIDWIDLAKGINLIFVIVCHTITKGETAQIFRGTLYTFQMPLFFILSALTFKLSADNGQFISKTEKAFKRLIVPALLVFAFKSAVSLFSVDNIKWAVFFAKKINSFFYGSAPIIHIQEAEILGVGMLWFFFALFAGRTLFDYLHLKLKEERQLLFAVCACACVGIMAAKIQYLPLSLDIALACMPFFYFGYYLKSCKIAENNRKIAVISALIWIASAMFCYFYIGDCRSFYINLAVRRYPLIPIFYICAMAGTLFVSCCSIFLTDRFPKSIKPLLYIGKNSLYLFCIHAMDSLYKNIWRIIDSSICSCIIRLSVDLLLFAALVKIIELIKNRADKSSASESRVQPPLPEQKSEAAGCSKGSA